MSNLSPAPGTPQTPAKAIWAAVSTALVASLLVLWVALTDDKVTNQEIVQILLALLGAPGVVGYGTYRTANRPKR